MVIEGRKEELRQMNDHCVYEWVDEREARGHKVETSRWLDDIQYSVKTALQDMAKPNRLMMLRLKRIGRYVLGARGLVWVFNHQDMPGTVDTYCDANFAAEETAMRSTTCLMDFFGSHLIDSSSTTQSVVALSTGEAEFYGLVKGAASAIQSAELLREVGVDIKARVLTDSMAAAGMVKRHGHGRAKHIAAKFLWVQKRLALGDFKVEKVHTDSNPSDLGTKYHDTKRLQQLSNIAGLQLRRPVQAALAMLMVVGADATNTGAFQAGAVFSLFWEYNFVFETLVGAIFFLMVGLVCVARRWQAKPRFADEGIQTD
jgi:hypothetical protein